MSPYNDFSAKLAELAEQVNGYIGAVSVPFPGKGATVDAANAKREAMAQHLGALAEWLQTASGTASTQASFDKALESAPSPEDIKQLREECHASGNAKEDVDTLSDAMKEKADAQKRHNGDTAGTAWGDQPAAPAGCPVPGADGSLGNPNGDYGDGTGGGLGDLGGDTTDERGMGGERTGDAHKDNLDGGVLDAPAGDSGASAPANSGSVQDTLKAAPVSDANVGTETSGDTATMTPTAGAGGALSQPTQATPGGQPMQGMGGAPSVSTGPTGGAAPQVSQPQGARGGTPSQSPEKRREEADKRDERDAVTDAGAGVVGGTAAGVASAGLGAASPTSPTTNTSGAQSVTPPPTNTPPTANAGANPAGGGMGGGGVRPPNAPLGSGETVNGSNAMKPIYRTDTPDWERELDALLGIDPDDNEEPK